MRRLLALTTLVFLACGEGTTESIPPSFALALSTTSLVVEQDGVASTTATVAREGGFAEPVYLSVSGLPEGIAAAFNPNTLGPASSATTLTITATTIATPGTYTITLRAESGTDVDPQAMTVQITVSAKPAVQLAVPVATIEVVQGQEATVTATLARTNFTGAVSVTPLNALPGVGLAITPSGDAYQLAVSVAEDVSPTTYALTIAATGVGVSTSTVTLNVTVLPKPKLTLALSTSAASVLPGTSTSFVLSTTSVGFDGAITYEVLDVPSGVVASIDESSGAPSVTLSIAGDVIPGSYQLRVRATAGATGPTTQTFVLDVLAPLGRIALSAQQSVPLIAGGAPVSTIVNVGRSNYSGLVTFRTSQLPAGITATFSNGTLGGSALFTFSVASTTALGSYPVLITGQGLGISNSTTQLVLVVTAPTVGSIALAVTNASFTASVGQRITTTARVVRTNFADPVIVSAFAPPSIQVTVSAVSSSADEYNVDIVLGDGTPAGQHNVVLSATGNGVAAVQAVLSVAVPPSGIGVALSSASLDVAQGGSGSISGVVSRTNYSGPIAITLSGAPSTMSAMVTMNGDAFTISIAAGSTAPLGHHTLRLVASGGVLTTSVDFLVNVTVPQVPGVALIPDSRTLTISSTGLSQTISLEIVRLSYFGSLRFELARAPAGAMVTPHYPVVGTKFLTAVSIPVTTPPGTYTVDLIATSPQGTVGRVEMTIVMPLLPSVQFASSSTKLTVVQGSSLSVLFPIIRKAYSGPITVTFGISDKWPQPLPSLVAFDALANLFTVRFGAEHLPAPGVYRWQFSVAGPNSSICDVEVTVVAPPPP